MLSNHVRTLVKTETFFMTQFMDEDSINAKLVDLGFIMEHTRWVYSWTVPSWVAPSKKKEIEDRLENSEYRSYLVNVRQELPN